MKKLLFPLLLLGFLTQSLIGQTPETIEINLQDIEKIILVKKSTKADSPVIVPTNPTTGTTVVTPPTNPNTSTTSIEEPIRNGSSLNFYGVNFSNEIDQFPQAKVDRLRLFYLQEHDLPGNGVFSAGGKFPKDHKFHLVPTNPNKKYKDVKTWDGSMYDNHTRIMRVKKQCKELTTSFEVIRNYNGVFNPFPAKLFPMWQWGNNPSEQYKKIYEHTYAFLVANGDYVDYMELGNEDWILTATEWSIVESARIDAWVAWNKKQGRKDYKTFKPKVASVALPIGQALWFPVNMGDFVGEKYKHVYAEGYINVHIYSIDRDGKWSMDFDNIVGPQIDSVIRFVQSYNPYCKIRITETGYPQEGALAYYEWLNGYLAKYPQIEAVHAYSYAPIKNIRFGDCYMVGNDGAVTEAWKTIKNLRPTAVQQN